MLALARLGVSKKEPESVIKHVHILIRGMPFLLFLTLSIMYLDPFCVVLEYTCTGARYT